MIVDDENKEASVEKRKRLQKSGVKYFLQILVCVQSLNQMSVKVVYYILNYRSIFRVFGIASK